MKNIKDMSVTEFRSYAGDLESFSYNVYKAATSLFELLERSEEAEDYLNRIKSRADEVRKLESRVYKACAWLIDPETENAELFVRQMCRLGKDISVVFAQMCSDVFGWTELDIHEIVNSSVEDGGLNGKEQA